MDEAPKRRGRRPIDPDDPSVQVGVSFPRKIFDHYCRRALERDVSVAEIIRQDLRARRRDE